MHLTIGIFGERKLANDLASRLAKKGTTNDIAIYNQASSEGVLTYVVPNSESGKISPLLECLRMSDVPVLVLGDALTKEDGEALIAILEAGFTSGIILANPGMADTIRPILTQLKMTDSIFVGDDNELRLKVLEFGSKIDRTRKASAPLLIQIDNSFKVKGVGTIALGFVESGTVKKHDSLTIEPSGEQTEIKGIQSQDRDFEEAGPGTRVGLNLKDVEPEDISRGCILCRKSEGIVKKSAELTLKFRKNPMFRQEIKDGTRVMLGIGLQVESCTVKSLTDDSMTLAGSGPVAFTSGQRCIIASQNDILPRIIGSGTVAS
jgi:selenocysteine-specific translation elongation factor